MCGEDQLNSSVNLDFQSLHMLIRFGFESIGGYKIVFPS